MTYLVGIYLGICNVGEVFFPKILFGINSGSFNVDPNVVDLFFPSSSNCLSSLRSTTELFQGVYLSNCPSIEYPIAPITAANGKTTYGAYVEIARINIGHMISVSCFSYNVRKLWIWDLEIKILIDSMNSNDGEHFAIQYDINYNTMRNKYE